MRLSIVVPSFEGAEGLAELIPLLHSELESSGYAWELIIVDDGSGDENWRRIEELCRRYDQVSALGLTENRGQQIATLTGLAFCRGEYIVTMDDDLEHRPSEIHDLIRTLEQGYDLVYGVRPLAYASPLRRLGAALRNLLFRLLLRPPHGVRLSSFRAMRSSLANSVLTGPCPFPYLSAMALQYQPGCSALELRPTPRRAGRQRLGRLVLSLAGIAAAYSAPGAKRAKPFQAPAIARRTGTPR